MAASTRLLRALALGGAGLATFYVAAQWSRASRELGAADAIVQPVTAASAASAAMPAAPPPAQAWEPLAAPSTAASAASVPDALNARTVPSTNGRAFTRLSWLPPPPPPPPPAPAAPAPAPAPPTAPPLPFTFVGMVENGTGKPQAFLARGDTLLVVAAGDALDNNTYRVESLSATQIVLTYTPLNMKQTIDVSGGFK